jgi:hypothetical protein
MSLALRIIGGFFIFLAAGALAWEFYVLVDTGSLTVTSWGELWYRLHAPSLNLYQVVVERHISPALWDMLLAPLLIWPAVLVFLLPGVLLIWLPRLHEMLTKDGPVAQG